jgi:hypothetical protein
MGNILPGDHVMSLQKHPGQNLDGVAGGYQYVDFVGTLVSALAVLAGGYYR